MPSDTEYEELNTIQFAATNPPVAKNSPCLNIVAVTGSVLSIIAVAPVPYLILRSIYYLATDETDTPFEEMMKSNSPVFWVFGPSMALLGTMAIAPFNVYNTYKTIVAGKYDRHCLTPGRVCKMITGVLFLSSGSVNGYNMNYAYVDIFGQSETILGHIAQGSVVGIGTVFAGISDARVVLSALQREIPRDYRHFKRPLQKACEKAGFFQHRYHSFGKKQLLASIRKKLDDFRLVCELALTDTEIKQHRQLIMNSGWTTDIQSLEFTEFLALMKRDFPMARAISSEVLGSGVSALLAYFGNQNMMNYAYRAVTDFLKYCGVSTENMFVNALCHGFSYLSYGIGFLLSLFLIRGLFFRDVCKATTMEEFKARFLKAALPLLPALSFGSLNVFLTMMNDELSPFNKILVSFAAIIGATVVSRYGIEGGMEEFMGKENLRGKLSNVPEQLMTHFKELPLDQLQAVNEQLSQIEYFNASVAARHQSV